MRQAESNGPARHGGRLAEAARAWPDAPGPWLDLSTGINPLAWRPSASIAVDTAPLPDPDALGALEAVAARFFGVAPARVAAVPGSEVALRLLGALDLPRPIVALTPCYGTHAAVADATIDAGELTAAASHGTLLLANPNNPDGRTLAPGRLATLAGRRARYGGWLVVDEAFADAQPNASVLPVLDPETPVVVLRSFGKFFGLAGVRLGFVVAPAIVVARVRALLGDWPVGAHAIAWGHTAYEDAAWTAAARIDLASRAARLDALLARHGLTTTGTCPLFRLVEDDRARALFAALAGTGILTRPFADRADWLRIGLPGDEAGFDRLDRALAGG